MHHTLSITSALSAVIPLAATGRTGAADPADLFANILPWLGVLAIFVIIGGIAIFFIRRMLQSGGSRDSEGFSLQTLRDLHAAGELSDEEFERAKQAMIGGLKAKKEVTAEWDSTAENAESKTGRGGNAEAE